MKQCQQTVNQSVYQHGISVRDHMFQLIDYLENDNLSEDWKIPNWLIKYKLQIKNKLLPKSIIEEYTTFHDNSKPYCKVIDENGNQHFTNHAELSGQKWLELGGNPQVAKLMKMDMIIHTMKDKDVDEFIIHPESITLLLTGLAEVHSNSKMFGGINSVPFKIKWNQINKRGNAITSKLFGE